MAGNTTMPKERAFPANAEEHEPHASLASKRVLLMGWDVSTLAPIRISVNTSGQMETTDAAYTIARSYDGSGNLQYEGFAAPGTLTSVATWMIRKYTWDGSNCTNVQYASGVSTFTKEWDDRATYTYS